jgi:hypothetical protein
MERKLTTTVSQSESHQESEGRASGVQRGLQLMSSTNCQFDGVGRVRLYLFSRELSAPRLGVSLAQ